MQKIRFPSFVVNIALLLFSLSAALLGAELGLRFLGYRPWQVKDIRIRVEPGGEFFAPDPQLGYTHIPGTFKVTLPDGYTFRVTHRDNGLRVTQPLAAYDPAVQRDEIWIFGCSFTHGWTLNDEETYPWLLQQRLPEYEIVNYGVSGYGTLQALIQFQQALSQRRPPKLVIVTYASFHDQRNTLLRLRSKQIVPWNKLGPLVQPYAWLDTQGDLQYAMADVTFQEFPLMRSSALSNFIETTYDSKVENRFYQSHEVSRAIIKEFARLAQAREVPLLVAGLLSDSLTTDMLAFAAGEGLMTADISVDLSQPANRNLPHDPHPSPAANEQYAHNLEPFLRSILNEPTLSSTLQPKN